MMVVSPLPSACTTPRTPPSIPMSAAVYRVGLNPDLKDGYNLWQLLLIFSVFPLAAEELTTSHTFEDKYSARRLVLHYSSDQLLHRPDPPFLFVMPFAPRLLSTEKTPSTFFLVNSTDLATMENLWLSYSKGKFGYSVQRDLWRKTKGDFENFCRRIGWTTMDAEVRSNFFFVFFFVFSFCPFFPRSFSFWQSNLFLLPGERECSVIQEYVNQSSRRDASKAKTRSNDPCRFTRTYEWCPLLSSSCACRPLESSWFLHIYARLFLSRLGQQQYSRRCRA